MFKNKKQLKEKIKRLEWDIEELKISKDIADSRLKIAEGEMKKAKSEANLWKSRVRNYQASIDKIRELEQKNLNIEEAKDFALQCYIEQSHKNIELNKENEELRKQLTCIRILDIMQENEELKKKIKTLSDAIINAKINLTIKDNEKYKLIKSISEKNTEISKLKDKNTELQGNIVTLTAAIQNLKK